MKKIWPIIIFTYLGIYKSKILVNSIILGGMLLLVSYLASSFSYGDSSKVALDMGLSVLNISIVAISIYFGSSLLNSEIENKTLYMILSRPISRFYFLLGKIIGLIGILISNAIILSVIIIGLFNFLGGQNSSLLVMSIVFIIFQGIFLLLITVYLSLITNKVLAIFSSIILYFAGHAINEVSQFVQTSNNELLVKFILFYKIFMPNFSYYNIKEFVLYEKYYPNINIINTFIYSLVYFVIILFLSKVSFDKKELV